RHVRLALLLADRPHLFELAVALDEAEAGGERRSLRLFELTGRLVVPACERVVGDRVQQGGPDATTPERPEDAGLRERAAGGRRRGDAAPRELAVDPREHVRGVRAHR